MQDLRNDAGGCQANGVWHLKEGDDPQDKMVFDSHAQLLKLTVQTLQKVDATKLLAKIKKSHNVALSFL